MRVKVTTEQGDQEFDAERAYILEDPPRLEIRRENDIVYIPWERLIAFAVERIG